MYYLWLILFSFAPGLIWVYYFYLKDKRRPEPPRLIISVFFWGMIATIPAIAIEFAADFFIPYSQTNDFWLILLSTILLVSPVEEIIKYLVVKITILPRKDFDEPLDGVIYCVTAALGFATFENILVAFSEGENAIILRFATATLMHAITAGIVGYYLGLNKFFYNVKNKENLPYKKPPRISTGIIIAIFLHSGYNIIAAFNTPYTLIFLGIFLTISFIILSKGIKELRRLKLASPQDLLDKSEQLDYNRNSNVVSLK